MSPSVRPLVGRWVAGYWLVGRSVWEVTLPCSYRSACLFNGAIQYFILGYISCIAMLVSTNQRKIANFKGMTEDRIGDKIVIEMSRIMLKIKVILEA